MSIVMTTPSVPYKITFYNKDKSIQKEVIIDNISDWPDASKHGSPDMDIYEPISKVTIISPNDYYGVRRSRCHLL